MLWFFVGSTAALLTSFGFVPQLLKMRRTKSVRDVSLLTFVQFSLGISLWAIYGLHLKDPIIVAANLVSLSVVLAGIGLYLRYSRGS